MLCVKWYKCALTLQFKNGRDSIPFHYYPAKIGSFRSNGIHSMVKNYSNGGLSWMWGCSKSNLLIWCPESVDPENFIRISPTNFWVILQKHTYTHEGMYNYRTLCCLETYQYNLLQGNIVQCSKLPGKLVTSKLYSGIWASYSQLSTERGEKLLNASPTEMSTKYGSRKKVCSDKESTVLFALSFRWSPDDCRGSSQKCHSSEAGNNFSTVLAKLFTRHTLQTVPEQRWNLCSVFLALVSEILTLINAEENWSGRATCVTTCSNVT